MASPNFPDLLFHSNPPFPANPEMLQNNSDLQHHASDCTSIPSHPTNNSNPQLPERLPILPLVNSPGSWGPCPSWSSSCDPPLVHSPGSWGSCPSWSSSDRNPPLVHSPGSWGSCPSWSSSDCDPPLVHSPGSWGPCPSWHLSTNNSDHHHASRASIHSHPSNKSDQDYVPGSTFIPLITTSSPQSQPPPSDHIIQPRQAIRMLLVY